MSDLGWHVVNGNDLLAMLRKVAAGADPDLVYAEHYANAAHEYPEDWPAECEEFGCSDPEQESDQP